MGRDRRTRSGARAPGVERQKPFERRRFGAQPPPAQNGEPAYAAGSAKDGGKPSDTWAVSLGQALSEQPALKPYWGKPTVRNFREGNGNVGIMRSPLRAIALPDQSSGSPRGLFCGKPVNLGSGPSLRPLNHAMSLGTRQTPRTFPSCLTTIHAHAQ
jgi:hypothetical protein